LGRHKKVREKGRGKGKEGETTSCPRGKEKRKKKEGDQSLSKRHKKRDKKMFFEAKGEIHFQEGERGRIEMRR